jgi:RecB family endonuclease NucS
LTKIFNSLPLENKDKLAQLVAQHAQSLEEGLRVVDPGKGRGKWGPMDLLAVDGKGRPVIIDVAPQARDDLLVEGLSHLTWFNQYRHQMTALLKEKAQELFVHPRLILVAPDFSELCQKAITALEHVAVDLFRLRWLQSEGEEGLLIEPVFSSAAKEKIAAEPAVTLSNLPGTIQLAEEEIVSFLRMKPQFDL